MKKKKTIKSESISYGRASAEFKFSLFPDRTILYSYPLSNEPKRFVSEFCHYHKFNSPAGSLDDLVRKIFDEPADEELLSNLNRELDHFFCTIMDTFVSYDEYEAFVAIHGGVYVYLKQILNQIPAFYDVFCNFTFDHEEEQVYGYITPIIPIEENFGTLNRIMESTASRKLRATSKVDLNGSGGSTENFKLN